MTDQFANLRLQLEKEQWPSVYLFKFIVPNDVALVARANALFDDSADIKMQPSKTGKFISVSAKEMMMDVNSVIEKYEKASLIDGIIAL